MLEKKNRFNYEKSLITKGERGFGRDNTGKISTRHKGGGCFRRYRIIDFYRSKLDIYGHVKFIRYDPYRSSFIALILYLDGDKRYIIAVKDFVLNQQIISTYKKVDAFTGNCLLLKYVPLGINIHNLNSYRFKKPQFLRSSGVFGTIISKKKNRCIIRLRSGMLKPVSLNCRATIGIVSNISNNSTTFFKAGKVRWKGIRPTVRGVAMNPIDHPHGGGEGRTSGGRHPTSPWGLLTKGKKTSRKLKFKKIVI